MSSSSLALSGLFCDPGEDGAGACARGDDGPATGELTVDLRMGEAREEAFDGGRPSLDGEGGVGFCLRKKSPAVVAVVFVLLSSEMLGLWLRSGGRDDLPERASGGIDGGGRVALCGGVWVPPPSIRRKPFIFYVN
jgi:hypothetical protein